MSTASTRARVLCTHARARSPDTQRESPVRVASFPSNVTAAFNRNALNHLNQRFGFDFALDGYTHVGFYNEARGRVEMHLESLHEQSVTFGSRVRRFAPGDRIHTEYSYKYHAKEFQALLRDAGFARVQHWASPNDGFFVFYAN